MCVALFCGQGSGTGCRAGHLQHKLRLTTTRKTDLVSNRHKLTQRAYELMIKAKLNSGVFPWLGPTKSQT